MYQQAGDNLSKFENSTEHKANKRQALITSFSLAPLSPLCILPPQVPVLQGTNNQQKIK